MKITGFPQNVVQNILADLEEQQLIERNNRNKYSALSVSNVLDLSVNEAARLQKERELRAMEDYTQVEGCFMGYLTTYLGDQTGYFCGVCRYCRPLNFPATVGPERIRQAAMNFLEKDFLPRIARRSGKHEAGCSLSLYKGSHAGELVRLSKYKDAGPFPEELVFRAVEVIKKHYPVHTIDGVVSVPPTRSGKLVEIFARQVADMLHVNYISALVKIRATGEQKDFTNWVQKADNVKGAFSVTSPELVAGCTLIVIDDIYDSGYTIREIGQTLMRAGTQAVYPLTITCTAHSDDQ